MVSPIVHPIRRRNWVKVASTRALPARIWASFIRADLVGDSQHGHAPRKNLVAQKIVSAGAALLGGPLKHRFQHPPVGVQFAGQTFQGPRFGRMHEFVVGSDGGVGIVAGFEQAVPVAFGFAGLGFEEVVAHVGAGDVNIAANPLQQAGAGDEFLPHGIVRGANLVQRLDAVEPGEAQQHQEAAKASEQHYAACHLPWIDHAGASLHYAERARGLVRGSRLFWIGGGDVRPAATRFT